LGFWKALPQVFATTRTQRCWAHKTTDVLDKLPKRLQPEAKGRYHGRSLISDSNTNLPSAHGHSASHTLEILHPLSDKLIGETA